MFKKIVLVLSVLFLLSSFAACVEKYNLNTPIGAFNMTVEIAEKYESTLPADGNQFLIVRLNPASPETTVEKMQEYFRADGEGPGAIAECGEGEYTFSSMHFEQIEGSQVCVIIFEIPSELVSSDKITLTLPKENS